MNNYRSNNRKHRFKSNNDRNFRKRLINPHKNQNEFNSNIDFRHRNSGRNNVGYYAVRNSLHWPACFEAKWIKAQH